jgi:glyoxylase-like metal-dependent hydrolase (beta-lactamase superfamily II)
MTTPNVRPFVHQKTNTITYIVSDPDSSHCMVIDAVLDFDASAGRTSTESVDHIISQIGDAGLSVDWILETHIHADHISAAPYLRDKLGGKTCIGSGVVEVQQTFGKLFNAESGFATDGSQFDRMLGDGEKLPLGNLEVTVLHTPGHTPACVSYHVGNAVFVGDTLFMPDSGSARCDFPGGCSRTLYRSLQRILSLPDDTRVFIGHDYGAGGKREIAWESTVADQRAHNIHLAGGVTEAEYVKLRDERDATLSMPQLILPSVQVNMRAGQFPPAEENGVSYLKLPLNAV